MVLLYFGSEWMVSGAKKIAIRLGVTPFVVGITIVALGSAAPDAVTTLASGSNPQIIMGSVVGSIIVNIGLAIGIAALIHPLACKFSDIKFETVSMLAAVIIVSILALTGTLGPLEGVVLLASLSVFMYLTYRFKMKSLHDKEKDTAFITECMRTAKCKCVIMVILGIILLYFGANAFIAGAVELAELFGVSDLMIGLVVVAIGVSLPEMCISAVAAYRKENELVVSNIIGSIIFNCFFALGLGVMYTTVSVSYYTLAFHFPVMILMVILLAAMIRGGNKVSRGQGVALLSIYAAYIVLMGVFPQLTQGLL